MPQVTLYLDDTTSARMKAAARAAGVSQSRWLAEVVRQKTATEWPAAVAELAGSWANVPTGETLRRRKGRDARREPL
jgi:hypothetical protein